MSTLEALNPTACDLLVGVEGLYRGVAAAMLPALLGFADMWRTYATLKRHALRPYLNWTLQGRLRFAGVRFECLEDGTRLVARTRIGVIVIVLRSLWLLALWCLWFCPLWPALVCGVALFVVAIALGSAGPQRPMPEGACDDGQGPIEADSGRQAPNRPVYG